MKYALGIKKLNPEAQVYVLYRDIRTYGLLEDYYTEARKQGVIFIRFEPEAPPQVVKTAAGIAVRVKDHVLQRELEIAAYRVVLSAGVTAADTAELSGIMKFNRTPEGFFIEAHVKLRPVDMPSEGVYLCGTAHGPKLISETIAQAQAAAARASTLLAKDSVKLSAITATVDTERCLKCLTCVCSCRRPSRWPRKAGLDTNRLLEVVQKTSGAAYSGMAKLLLGRGFDNAFFQLALAEKDVGLAVASAQGLGVPMPMIEAARATYARAVAMGHGPRLFAGTLLAIEEAAGVEVPPLS